MNFNQLLFTISNKTEEYAYGSLAMCYTSKLPMYKYMNIIRAVDDVYSAVILQICDCILRKEDDKAQELIDYYAQQWGFIHE